MSEQGWLSGRKGRRRMCVPAESKRDVGGGGVRGTLAPPAAVCVSGTSRRRHLAAQTVARAPCAAPAHPHPSHPHTAHVWPRHGSLKALATRYESKGAHLRRLLQLGDLVVLPERLIRFLPDERLQLRPK